MFSSSKKRRRGQLYTRKRKLFTLQPCSTRQRNLPTRAIRCIGSQYCKRRVFVLLRNRFFFTFSLPSLCCLPISSLTVNQLPLVSLVHCLNITACLQTSPERRLDVRDCENNSKLQRTQGRMTNVLFLFFYAFVTYF